MKKLIIKGPPETAFEAAKRHGVSIDIIGYTRYNTSIALSNADDIKLGSWFTEVIHTPFPDGTLLFYNDFTLDK